MHLYKDILGIITICIGLISYSDYFFNIFKGCTVPRSVSWLIWGVLSTIAFVVQYQAGGGPGAWITGFTACMCLLIAIISYFKCAEHFTLYDWIPLGGAALTLFLWWFTNNAVLAIILTTVTYAIGFIPTVHNAYLHPEEETATTFALNGFKFFLALFALDAYSLTTMLYSITIVVLNGLLVGVLLVRRKRSV